MAMTASSTINAAWSRSVYGAEPNVLGDISVRPVMAKTRRRSQLLTMSGMASASDLLTAMSGFEWIPSGMHSGPDLTASRRVRGKMTHRGHSEHLEATLYSMLSYREAGVRRPGRLAMERMDRWPYAR